MSEQIIEVISNFGFASVCCFYLLTRVTTAIDNNTKALRDLESLIKIKLE